MIKKNVFALAVFMRFFAVTVSQAQTLTLDGFLGVVKNSNQAFMGAASAEDAAKLLETEGKIIYSPTVFTTIQTGEEGRPSFMPSLNYEKIKSNSYLLGVSQNTPVGLQAKVYYTLSETEYRGMLPTYFEGRPAIEVGQSLWRNFFGREIRAGVEAQTSQAKAIKFQESFKKKIILAEAESSYWRLALARETYSIAKENLLRSKKIHKWASRRVQLSLADRSDLLQATTLLQSRQLELKMARNELQSAATAFNNSRGLSSSIVDQTLSPLSVSVSVLSKMKIPEKAIQREDLLAMIEQSSALKSQSQLGQEKNLPTLELFGIYAFNSKESTQSEAFSESFASNRPTSAIGIRFSSPLTFLDSKSVRDGYEEQKISAEYNLQRKKFLLEQDWNDLLRKFREAKERLVDANSLEAAQKEKLDYERKRQELGRTTLFQVLNFETDYLKSQEIRLKTTAELLQLAAQMKLYGVDNESR